MEADNIMSMSADDTPLQRLERLKSVGKQVEATSSRVDPSHEPAYFERASYERAQATCRKYSANLSMSSSMGLMMLLQHDNILIPLLQTGKSRTIRDLYDRYATTGKYILACYETDFTQPQSDSARYITMVRAMHQRIHAQMNASEQQQQQQHENDKYVWVNQYDMMLTQFAFVGLFLLWPQKCGAHHVTQSERNHIAYFWRLLSHKFGIEDRFNLFAYAHAHANDSDALTQLEMCRLTLEHMRVTRPNEMGLRMARGFMLAFEDLSWESTFEVVQDWWWPHVSLDGQPPRRLDSLVSRCKRAVFRLYFQVLMRFEPLRAWINAKYMLKFEKFCENAGEVRRKLDAKYPLIKYEPSAAAAAAPTVVGR